MEQLIDQIKTHLVEVEAFQSSDPEEVERFRIKFLGKKFNTSGEVVKKFESSISDLSKILFLFFK